MPLHVQLSIRKKAQGLGTGPAQVVDRAEQSQSNNSYYIVFTSMERVRVPLLPSVNACLTPNWLVSFCVLVCEWFKTYFVSLLVSSWQLTFFISACFGRRPLTLYLHVLLSSHSCWSRLDSDFVSSNPLSLFATSTTFSPGPAQFPFSFF